MTAGAAPIDLGFCTWTFDGTVWTSQNHCQNGGTCADVLPSKTNPGTFVDSDGVALPGASFLPDAAGVWTATIPEAIFRPKAEKKLKRTIALSEKSVDVPCI